MVTKLGSAQELSTFGGIDMQQHSIIVFTMAVQSTPTGSIEWLPMTVLHCCRSWYQGKCYCTVTSAAAPCCTISTFDSKAVKWTA